MRKILVSSAFLLILLNSCNADLGDRIAMCSGTCDCMEKIGNECSSKIDDVINIMNEMEGENSKYRTEVKQSNDATSQEVRELKEQINQAKQLVVTSKKNTEGLMAQVQNLINAVQNVNTMQQQYLQIVQNKLNQLG